MAWTVYPHGTLKQLSPMIWHLEGALPKMALKRSMVIIKDKRGLTVHNAIACKADTMQQIDKIGDVHSIIFPNAMHRMDGGAFAERYPNARLYAPLASLSAAQKKSPREVYALSELQSEVLETESVEGAGEKESIFKVSDDDGLTLIFNDALFNHPHVAGFGGWVLRALGSSGGPRVTPLAKLLLIKDRKRFNDQLERLANLPDLKRAIPGHGDVIEKNVQEVLLGVAGRL